MAYAFFSSLSTVTVQHLVDIANTYGDLEPVLNAAGFTQTVALSVANTVMNAICAVAFPHKWNEFIVPPIYSNSFQQDYAVVNPAGASGSLTLTGVTQVSAAAGTATYTGTITGREFGGWVGVPFVIAGFVTGGNNGTLMCVASSAGALVLKNTGGALETHAATAISAAGPLLNMSWLERGVAFDINNSASPKPFTRIECGRQLPQMTASYTVGGSVSDPRFRLNCFSHLAFFFSTLGPLHITHE